MLSASQLLLADGQLLQLVDAAFADSARRSGEHLVCRPGCNQCCHGAFAIGPLDALRLRTGMARLALTDPGLASAIESRAAAYLAEFIPSFPGDPESGILGTSEEAQEAFEDFANDAACPALNPITGACDIYDARPMTCRVFGPPLRLATADAPDTPASDQPASFAICDLCFTGATEEEIAAAEIFIPAAEEAELTAQASELQGSTADTIVAFCLTSSRV